MVALHERLTLLRLHRYDNDVEDGMRSFVDIITSTDGKQAYEAELIKKLPIHNEGENIITLIGAVEGAERQFKLLTSKGALMSDIIVVERDLATYNALLSVQCDLGFNLVYGDFYDVLKLNLLRGRRFSLVDYDGTEGIGDYTMKLADICSNYIHRVKALHIIASTRAAGNKAKECRLMAEFLEMPPVERLAYIRLKDRNEDVPPCGYKRVIKNAAPIDVLSKYLLELTHWKNLDISTYKGRHNMYGLLIT